MSGYGTSRPNGQSNISSDFVGKSGHSKGIPSSVDRGRKGICNSRSLSEFEEVLKIHGRGSLGVPATAIAANVLPIVRGVIDAAGEFLRARERKLLGLRKYRVANQNWFARGSLSRPVSDMGALFADLGKPAVFERRIRVGVNFTPRKFRSDAGWNRVVRRRSKIP